MLQTYAQIVSTQSLPPELGSRFLFLAIPPSLPSAWLALLLTKAGDVESNPGPTIHTNRAHIHQHSLQSFGLVTFVTNKQHTSIRCNHTHKTHWVHLKCTQIKQRQYKPDRRCAVHTPTQLVTTTPSTSNTTAHYQQNTTYPLTNNNQPKDKNIVILQININGIRNTIEELKNLVNSTQLHHHNTRNKTHTES